MSNFYNDVSALSISVELGPDWQPEKRIPADRTWLGRTRRYKLPKGTNAVMYRNWSLSGDKIDVSKAEVIPINWVETSHYPNEEMLQFGILDGAFVFANKSNAVSSPSWDGLNSLSLRYEERSRPPHIASTYHGPHDKDPGKGALLYSRQNAEEIVRHFDRSKLKNN